MGKTPGLEEESLAFAATVEEPRKKRTPRLDGAGLLRRTFAFDVFACPGFLCSSSHRLTGHHRGANLMGMNWIKTAEQSWDYIAFKTPRGYVLSVACGSVAVYSLNIPISEQDFRQGMADSSHFGKLAQHIRNAPSAYQDMHIEEPTN